MDELLRKFNEAGVRYLPMGGQVMRLLGLPHFLMGLGFLYLGARRIESVPFQ